MIMYDFIKVFNFIYSVSFSVIYNWQPEIFESVAERQEKGIKYIAHMYVYYIYIYFYTCSN